MKIIALAFSKLQLPHSAGMIAPNVCFPMKYFSFKILCFHSHCSGRFSMPCLLIQMACLWLQVPVDKTGPDSLCSELKTKVAQFVQAQRWLARESKCGEQWAASVQRKGYFLQIFHMEKEGFSFCNSHNITTGDSSGSDLVNHSTGALFYSCSLEFRVLMC